MEIVKTTAVVRAPDARLLGRALDVELRPERARLRERRERERRELDQVAADALLATLALCRRRGLRLWRLLRLRRRRRRGSGRRRRRRAAPGSGSTAERGRRRRCLLHVRDGERRVRGVVEGERHPGLLRAHRRRRQIERPCARGPRGGRRWHRSRRRRRGSRRIWLRREAHARPRRPMAIGLGSTVGGGGRSAAAHGEAGHEGGQRGASRDAGVEGGAQTGASTRGLGGGHPGRWLPPAAGLAAAAATLAARPAAAGQPPRPGWQPPWPAGQPPWQPPLAGPAARWPGPASQVAGRGQPGWQPVFGPWQPGGWRVAARWLGGGSQILGGGSHRFAWQPGHHFGPSHHLRGTGSYIDLPTS